MFLELERICASFKFSSFVERIVTFRVSSKGFADFKCIEHKQFKSRAYVLDFYYIIGPFYAGPFTPTFTMPQLNFNPF